MTRYTAPNQKIIRVHKDSYSGGYLTIGTEEWQDAFKSLKRITFGVYLYLSGNANGFELTLSRRDVMDRLGVSKDTYLRAVKELEEKGYLTHKNGPVWNFYTTPVNAGKDAKESDDDNENNENYESGDNESDNYEESNESESGENVGGMVAYTQPSCMRRSNHNGSVEATDMVAYTHTEINKYREEGFPKAFGLYECNVIVCDLNNKNSETITTSWWDNFLNSESYRDQITLPYVVWKNGFEFDDIGSLGDNVYKNSKIRMEEHK